MTNFSNINYFKQQSELLLEDFKTRYFDKNQNIYEYNPRNFNIISIFNDFDISDWDEDFEFNLNDAQNLIAQISGFKDLNDLISSSKFKLNFAKLLFENQHHANLEEWNTYLSSIKGINWSGLLDPDNRYSDDDYETFEEIFKKVFIEGNIQSDFVPYRLDLEEKWKHIDNVNEEEEDDDKNIDNKIEQEKVNLEFFKRQSKIFYKDYKQLQENNFEKDKVIFNIPQEHFDIDNVLSELNKRKGEKISLQNAQHIIARISGFKNWDELSHSSSAQMNIGALLLKYYKIGMDPHILDTAGMLVESELLADFGGESYTDEDELDMWKYVLNRLEA